jgi:hypothetical protein
MSARASTAQGSSKDRGIFSSRGHLYAAGVICTVEQA